MAAISKIPVQIFASYIVEKLRKMNPFMVHAVDESAYVLGGAVVHIPQAGNSPSVVKNRSEFPATAVQREDSYVTYSLDTFSTTPSHLTWQEENEISYDKQDSILNDHTETLIEAVGDETLYKWLKGYKTDGATADVVPASNIVFTSGASRAATETGQTGNRKKLTYADVQKLQTLFNKANVAKNDRFLLLESTMYQELIDSLTSNQMAAFQQTADLANGVVGRLCGFSIMERSTVVNMCAPVAESGTKGQDGYVAPVACAPIAPGTALNATDLVAGIAWQKDCVAIARGDIKSFQDIDSPSYYGDVFSAAVKAGARCRRGDWKGVAVIAQGTPA